MKININKNIGVVLGFVIIILGLYALGLFSDPKYDFETTHAEIQILCMNIHLAESENKDVEELYEILADKIYEYNFNASRIKNWQRDLPRRITSCVN